MRKKKTDKLSGPNELQASWLEEIKRYEQESDKWKKKADKVIRRYKDSRETRDYRTRYNILWSNVQVLKPAVYSQDPIPRVDRRFKDENKTAAVAANLLERCLKYAIECTKYGDVMRQCVHDRLVVGRGTSWVRYVPHFRDVELQTPTEIASDGVQVSDKQEQGDSDDPQTEQQLYYEEAIPDFVHWEDFGHTFGRTWEEVRAVWRIAYMTRDELVERFPDKGASISLDYKPWDDRKKVESKVTENMQRACIYEIWDKQTKQVIWIAKGESEELDCRDDPLGLEDFFPCPQPMFANLANDTIIPTPDYVQYQDQAEELDELTTRVSNIAKSIKNAGVYDAQAEGVQRLFTEGVENKLIPVAQWTRFAERGGLKSAMDLLPTKEMANTLVSLYEAREKTKADLYEITGISDIIRGFSSGGAKTATEQQIKSQFANLRLSELQREVQRFARDMLKIMGEVMAFKFTPETLMKISGVQLLTNDQKQQVQANNQQLQQKFQQLSQQAQQLHQPPPKPPTLPPDTQKGLNDPSVEDVVALLRNHSDFGFKIEIETDSTINTDIQQSRQDTNELIQSIGAFSQGVGIAIQMGLMSSDAARTLLNALLIKQHLSKEVEDALALPAQPQPNPQAQAQQAKAQAEQQKTQAQMQLEQQKLQGHMQLKGQELAADQAIEQQRLQSEHSLSQQKIDQDGQLGVLKLQMTPRQQ